MKVKRDRLFFDLPFDPLRNTLVLFQLKLE
jgi:hypothetical protein